ncbi:MAG: ATP-binding protein [Spirochaetes bacterium]|nr:ATP-binding protein [Spirochaetota bacterium]
MINYNNIDTTIAEPVATSMIETFRAIGYSVETAIADIIDNSITAHAENVWIDYIWDGPETMISITDDGHGMDNKELIQAMRPGSRYPLDDREPDDLGRFGLGLKTASFSQCRKFCVISRKRDCEPVYWTWDLDYVCDHSKSWSLIRYKPDNQNLYKKFNENETGTMVIWWDIDRLTKETSTDNEKSKKKFLEVMDSVKKHLGMVFHRYIDEGLNIIFRDRKVSSWDPFMTGIPGVQIRPETRLANDNVIVQGFILPHHSRLTPKEYNYGKGPKDSWTNHQGFYVYRNKRLLVAGDWLGMFKREHHYDLCRMKIELSNNLDNEWRIDIKKSQAKPPAPYRDVIFSIAKEARALAIEIHKHRGKIIKRTLSKDEFFPFWDEYNRHGKRFYRINRNHPIIKTLLDNAGDLKNKVQNALKFAEETVPIPLIMIRENEEENVHGKPFEGISPDPVVKVMKELFINLIKEGYSPEAAKARIISIEPFDSYPQYLHYLEK